MMTKVSFEYAAEQTDFKHEFKDDKVNPNLPNQTSSPYQTVIEQSNKIEIEGPQYTFLNGKNHGDYHMV